MRFVAMKLHTREQAPKEGEKRAEPKPEQQPMRQWEPTKEKYLAFLVESKVMYEAMEEIVASGESPQYAAFVNTGLERTEGLTKGKELSHSPRSASAIAHTRTRRDYYLCPDCLLIHITSD